MSSVSFRRIASKQKSIGLFFFLKIIRGRNRVYRCQHGFGDAFENQENSSGKPGLFS
jgi:hypothetical protein